ncbi:MAG: EcsC family protein [Pseudomonadota bacterium]|nr:EcsC family protein [Pseudomonadota bacterium]
MKKTKIAARSTGKGSSPEITAPSLVIQAAGRNMAPEDLELLRQAARSLEHPSFAIRLSSVLGTPIEKAEKFLPQPAYKLIYSTAHTAIEKAFEAAVSSLRNGRKRRPPRNVFYRTLAAGTGAVGGLFGLYGLLLDLPISTTIMLRSIAEIARANGEDLYTLESRMACLEVFALGGHAETDNAAESGYYGLRFALALPVTQATRYVSRYGMAAQGAPMLTSLVQAVSARFGAVVSQRAAAQMVPLIGAAGGSALNLLFISHFQEMARGHFVVRRLERKYGPELVSQVYKEFRSEA